MNNNEQYDPEHPIDSIRNNLNLQMAFLATLWLFFTLLGGMIGQGIGSAAGIESMKDLLAEFKKGNFLDLINVVKVIGICTHIFQYTIPVLMFTLLLYRKAPLESLMLNKPPQLKHLLYSIVLVGSIYPFISFVYYWNTALLPANAISKDTLDLQSFLMDMKSPIDFVLNIILLGFVAGIGEELLFRGVLQKLFTKLSKNVHFGALSTGFLFSLMHFQLEGFIPRMILGTLFCYLLIFTANLWITMIIHILFNSFQVAIPYCYPQSMEKINEVQEVSPFLAAASLLVFIGILVIFTKQNTKSAYIEIIEKI